MNGLLGTAAVADEKSTSTTIRIRVARTRDDMNRAVAVRYQAYSEKFQGLAEDVNRPEDLDFEINPIILIAEDKSTGEVFATARLNHGLEIRNYLSEIDLPKSLDKESLGYLSRMAATGPVDRKNMARFLIHKAMFQICMAKQVTMMLTLVGRVRSKLYMPLGFRPIFPANHLVHPAIVRGRPVALLGLKTYELARYLQEHDPVRYEFAFQRFHESIEVFNSVSSLSARAADARGTLHLHNASPRSTQGVVVPLAKVASW